MNTVAYGQLTKTGRPQWLARSGDRVSLVLIAIALFRIAATFTVLSDTSDEAVHLTAGLELLGRGTYSVQRENPPLPRLILAAPLHFAGVRFQPDVDVLSQMKQLFHSKDRYKTNLFLGRAGNLFFFLIAAVATTLGARRELGSAGAAIATFLFTAQPVVLGYSGIANHDAAALAGVAVCLLLFARWMECPTAVRSIVFGLAFGVSIACKFSCLVYVPLACAAFYLAQVTRDEKTRRAWRRALLALPLAAAAAFLTLWASYGFDLTNFVAGIAGLRAIDRGGFTSYLFGEVSETGWWWYFPVAVAVKTTLASLLLVLAGVLLVRRRAFHAPLLAAMAVLIAAAPSTLDLGVRYVLPLYAPLTIAMAVAAMELLGSARRSLRIAAILLLLWHGGASLLAHPDYFPYFNELAGRDPSRVLVDSNLDWGQDVLRLRDELRRRNVSFIRVSLAGATDLDRLGFPPHGNADLWTLQHGWVAVSDHAYRIHRSGGGWMWLHRRPYERIGTSIRLYNIP